MKKKYLFCFLCFSVHYSNAQVSNPSSADNVSVSETKPIEKVQANPPINMACKLYGVQFIIKDEIKTPISVLQQIDISLYLPLRQPTENVEVVDSVTGKTLIIFSEDELRIIREPIYNYSDFTLENNPKSK